MRRLIIRKTNISISIIYHPSTAELQFDCPSYRCAVRTKLIANLRAEKIRFVNCGSILWVERREFKSVNDISEKAFRGFIELTNFKSDETYDPAGEKMEFGYTSIPHTVKYRPLGLFIEHKTKTRMVSSKNLLDAHYKTQSISPHFPACRLA